MGSSKVHEILLGMFQSADHNLTRLQCDASPYVPVGSLVANKTC
ncbi:MAG: hypothetical protein ACREJB_17120 [Planctomycetaceae bacterium]